MNANFEYVSNLQYRVKDLKAQVALFKSGEKYQAMQREFQKNYNEQTRMINELKYQLSVAHSETVTVRNIWFDTFEDMLSSHEKELAKKSKEIDKLNKKILATEIKLEEAHILIRNKSEELYAVKTLLEEEKEKNLKLTAQINRNYENSSIPSSQNPNRKKIENNREKTGRKPGGQLGHKGHTRKKQEPTERVEIAPPKEYVDSSNYKETGKIITKQLIDIEVRLLVTEYSTPEYRNIHTGTRVHAAFPEGVVNDVNYGGSVKAFALLLNNYCNVGIDKTKDFLVELTDGKLELSKGMISGLSKKFSLKTEKERKEIWNDLLLSPVVNADFTAGRVNGKTKQIIVCCNEKNTLYLSKDHKGHEGIKGTVLEDYYGIIIHDHDKTFYKYGTEHQECLSHILRYLKSSIENEPNLTWNKKMHSLLQEMIHERKSLPKENEMPLLVADGYKARYIDILAKAKEEYEYEPPSDYYKDGYNLYNRLEEYIDAHLLFLYDKRVDATNNLAERTLRIFKRKQKQVMSFRSADNLQYLCDCMSVIELLRSKEENLYNSVASIFA